MADPLTDVATPCDPDSTAISRYLYDPLQKCLTDDDPYVRKTAAICVTKLHDMSPEMVEVRGLASLSLDVN